VKKQQLHKKNKGAEQQISENDSDPPSRQSSS